MIFNPHVTLPVFENLNPVMLSFGSRPGGLGLRNPDAIAHELRQYTNGS